MRIPKYLILVILLFGAPAIIHGQSFKDKAMALLYRFNQPVRDLDSTFFYQMKPRWHANVSGMTRRAGVEQINRFDVLMTQSKENGQTIAQKVPGILSFGLNENLYTGTGIGGGYGSVSLSFSAEVGRKSALKNRTLGYSYCAKNLGADIQYSYYEQPLSYEMTMGSEGSGNYSHEQSVSKYPGEMIVLLVDLFYALNRRSFSFPAAYRPGVVQCKTAGSWMLSAKYLQGETVLDPKDVLAGWLGDLSRHRTGQLSFGAGYSLNWVPFHRMKDRNEKTLRNLTVNVTALPMLTYYNKSSFYQTVFDAAGKPQGTELVSKVYGAVRINYMTRMGICYIHGPFLINLIGDYDSFVAKGTTSVKRDYVKYSDFETEALFHKWTATLCLNYNF